MHDIHFQVLLVPWHRYSYELDNLMFIIIINYDVDICIFTYNCMFRTKINLIENEECMRSNDNNKSTSVDI